jgi:hypothetical protein
MTKQTTEEHRQQNIDAMGQELGEQYSELWQEIVRLHLTWSEFCELFTKTPKRVEVLNRAAATFFGIVQKTLFEATLLHIGRLTDASKVAGRDNLTVRNLSGLILDATLKAAVSQSVEKAVKAADFARDWRHRRLAHNDLELALNDMRAEPLAEASKKQVDDALDKLADTLNAVAYHYLGSGTIFDLHAAKNGGSSLIYVLFDGLKERDRRLEPIEQGKSPEDWIYPPDL